MAVSYEDKAVVFSGSVYENELEGLSSYLKEHKEGVTFDCTACKDMHGGVIQLLLAYKTRFGGTFAFGDEKRVYQMALEGFRSVEDDCNK